MSVVKALFIAVSMYSKIPVPQFEWKEKDMRYVMLFFPIVGIITGLAELLWYRAGVYAGVGRIAACAVAILIPLVITGGIHVDGFMDTMDALSSYATAERKKEILKDSHIGAFSVIKLVMCGLCYIAAWSELTDIQAVLAVSAGFWLSRILSAISVISFPKARTDGTVAEFAKDSVPVRKRLLILLGLQLILCCAIMLFAAGIYAAVVIGVSIIALIIYRQVMLREIGGVTGDTSGFFVTVCECAQACAAALIIIVQ